MKTSVSWSIEELLTRFRVHLRENCGLADGSCQLYLRHASTFLSAVATPGKTIEPGTLTRRQLLEFLSQRTKAFGSTATVKSLITALRSLLRFFELQGLCDARLVEAVPTIPHRRLSDLPRVLSDEQLSLLLQAFDRSTESGLRGRAIALCLARVALRACEVARLSLDNIDWRAGTLEVSRSKGRRGSLLPLPAEVGDAIVAYLRLGRPTTKERAVFVRHAPPVGAPLTAEAIRAVIRHGFERAGIEVPSKGTHILRHTAASRMVCAGASLKDVADVLRHRSIDTTALYTKVDLPSLRAIALPWPEVR